MKLKISKKKRKSTRLYYRPEILLKQNLELSDGNSHLTKIFQWDLWIFVLHIRINIDRNKDNYQKKNLHELDKSTNKVPQWKQSFTHFRKL